MISFRSSLRAHENAEEDEAVRFKVISDVVVASEGPGNEDSKCEKERAQFYLRPSDPNLMHAGAYMHMRLEQTRRTNRISLGSMGVGNAVPRSLDRGQDLIRGVD